MTRTFTAFILCFALLGCGASNQTPDRGPTGSGGSGSGPTGSGGSAAVGSTPLFTRADCGTLAASDLKPSTNAATPTTFAAGQLVGGRVDPDSVTNQEHYWAIQLAPGFYHLVLDARTANGVSGNIGIVITQRLANGDEERLLYGNEIGRLYRDDTFFEVKAPTLVSLHLKSQFGMEDYLMAVFANGTPVPSPLFDKCPTVMPLTVAQPAMFAVGAADSATQDRWFLVELPIGNYKFTFDAAQADGISTNLSYRAEVLDRFGGEPRAKSIVFENNIGIRLSNEGTLAIGEAGSYWVRIRNGFGNLNMTMTVSTQAN